MVLKKIDSQNKQPTLRDQGLNDSSPVIPEENTHDSNRPTEEIPTKYEANQLNNIENKDSTELSDPAKNSSETPLNKEDNIPNETSQEKLPLPLVQQNNGEDLEDLSNCIPIQLPFSSSSFENQISTNNPRVENPSPIKPDENTRPKSPQDSTPNNTSAHEKRPHLTQLPHSEISTTPSTSFSFLLNAMAQNKVATGASLALMIGGIGLACAGIVLFPGTVPLALIIAGLASVVAGVALSSRILTTGSLGFHSRGTTERPPINDREHSAEGESPTYPF